MIATRIILVNWQVCAPRKRCAPTKMRAKKMNKDIVGLAVIGIAGDGAFEVIAKGTMLMFR